MHHLNNSFVKNALYSHWPPYIFSTISFIEVSSWLVHLTGTRASHKLSGVSDQSAFDVPSLLADGHCSEYLAVYSGETELTQPTLFFPELLTCPVNSCIEQSSGLLPLTSNLLSANT